MVGDMWHVNKPEFTFVRQKDLGTKKIFRTSVWSSVKHIYLVTKKTSIHVPLAMPPTTRLMVVQSGTNHRD
jgi:hypothetical protein